MNYQKLGRTDLVVSELALGTVELGLEYGIRAPGHVQRPSTVEAVRLLNGALDEGINHIDTARAYGDSERVIGEALAGRRSQVILATKATIHGGERSVPDGGELRRVMLSSLETSLHFLQTDYIDLWQIHNVDDAVLARHDVIAELFAELRGQGMIRATGGSFYGTKLPLSALEMDLFDVYQVTYSVLDQRLEDSFFARAADSGVGVVARSVLLKGALTARADYLPDRLDLLRIRSREFRQKVRDTVPSLQPAQVAIGFALAHPQIHSVLVGISSESELRECLRATKQPLPEDLLLELRALRLDDPMLLDPGQWGIP